MTSRTPNVLTISPASPFLSTFVDALMAGDIVAGMRLGEDPLALADTLVYVPTQRAARALADLFVRRSGADSVVLPRILPLGALEDTETQLILGESDPEHSPFPLKPAAGSIWRRLNLARLIQGWARAVDGALRAVDAEGRLITDPTERFRVATSTVDAFALAGDLAALIDEMLIEGVEWHALDGLAMARFDDYWRITTTFLSIAFAQWPHVLEKHGLIDAAARQIALVEAQARVFDDPNASSPVFAIGSTGTNRATARLLSAIARAPRGAVVLPGLDLDLDDEAWSQIGGRIAADQEPSFGHPQAAMARLLPVLGVTRAQVRTIGEPSPASATRARFVAEAMRPADTTDLWRSYRRDVSESTLRDALAGVSLIKAADEREEALCLAITMREVLETPGRSAMLVTPDRDLARRVRGELLRWNVEVLDSGGVPLATCPLGVVARLALAAAGEGPRALTALLAHPLASFGFQREEVARLAGLLDIGVLRILPVADVDADTLFGQARAAAHDRHAHRAQAAIAEADWAAMRELWDVVAAALAPLTDLRDEMPVADWVAAHRAALAAIVTEETDADEGAALEALFAELEQARSVPLSLDREGYAIFFARLAGEVTLRNTARPHPCLGIYGLLEARLMTADVVLLGGLDETVWPPQAKADPFLNRPMRHDLGLLPPERRLGQTAHDFCQALGNPAVVLSRAAKRGGSPCVPSRFLLRMQALAGAAFAPCRERGRRWRDLARTIDASARSAVPAKRPAPTPPVALRPRHFSVTEIETLRRDPYALFASRILELKPLPRLEAEIGPSDFGSRMHDALHRFTAHPAAEGDTAARRAALADILRDAFAVHLGDAMFRALRWPVVEKTAGVFLSFDAKQRETASRVLAEQSGKIDIALADGSSVRLIARADRIDHHRDGSATLIDYKTGQPPGLGEVQVGFAPQLTLEAAMLARGGFGVLHEGEIRALYLKLGGKTGGGARAVTFKDETFADVAERHYEGLISLLSSFRLEKTGYPSRPFPKFARAYGDYDHLARVREWSLAGDEEAAS